MVRLATTKKKKVRALTNWSLTPKGVAPEPAPKSLGRIEACDGHLRGSL